MRAERQQLRDPEDHVRRRVVLDDLAVDLCPQPLIAGRSELAGGHNHGPERAEGIEALAPGPLTVTELDITCRDIVGHRISKHVLEGGLDRDVLHPPANHDPEFDLPVDSLGDFGVDLDRIGGTDDTRRELTENQRKRWRLHPRLAGVVVVVEPDRDDLAGRRGASMRS